MIQLHTPVSQTMVDLSQTMVDLIEDVDLKQQTMEMNNLLEPYHLPDSAQSANENGARHYFR